MIIVFVKRGEPVSKYRRGRAGSELLWVDFRGQDHQKFVKNKISIHNF